jgi:hypothetical protein
VVARFAVKPTVLDPDAARTVDAYGDEPRSSTKAATTLASASAPCRSARRWSPASSPTTILRHRGQVGPRAVSLALSRAHGWRSITRRLRPIEAFARRRDRRRRRRLDRENEGDLIRRGMLCTPEKMAFIIRILRHRLRALTRPEARRLRLDPMVAATTRRSAPPSRCRSTSATG